MNTPTLAELEKAMQQLQAQISKLRDAAAKQVKPVTRYDAYGRLLEVPKLLGTTYYFLDAGGDVNQTRWDTPELDVDILSAGNAFISSEAAEAELTRLKCLQRLRGMPGYNLHGGAYVCRVCRAVYLSYLSEADAKMAYVSITPAEREAFNYEEPGYAE